jgi:hypothetical protein
LGGGVVPPTKREGPEVTTFSIQKEWETGMVLQGKDSGSYLWWDSIVTTTSIQFEGAIFIYCYAEWRPKAGI